MMPKSIQSIELIGSGNEVYAVYINYDGDLFVKVFDARSLKEIAVLDLKTEGVIHLQPSYESLKNKFTALTKKGVVTFLLPLEFSSSKSSQPVPL